MSNNKSPLYEVIFKHYKSLIKSSELIAGAKLPSEMEIAKDFNVSRITATRALKELELRNLIYKVKGSGSYVSEYEDQTDNSTSIKDSRLSIISLVIPQIGTYSTDLLKGIEDYAKEKNNFVTFHNSSDSPEQEKEIIEEIISRGSHGVIVYPVNTSENMDLYSSLLIDKYPFVLIDRKIPGIDTSLVWADNKSSFSDLTNHLFNLGHKKIIFVGTTVFKISSEFERYNGFCKAHLDQGIPLLKNHLYSESNLKVPENYRPEDSIELREAHYLFDLLESITKEDRPTAIAAVNDDVANILMSTATSRGIKIPEDYSLSGFDDLPFSSHLSVPLTTVAQPAYEIGRAAAEELFESIQKPERVFCTRTIKSELIIRASTSLPKEIK